MKTAWLMIILLALPMLMAFICLGIRSAGAIIKFCAAGTLTVAAVAAVLVWRVFHQGAVYLARDWFMVDALSAYHMVIMMIVFSLSSLYAISYFRHEVETLVFNRREAKRYGALWFGSLAAMMLVLVSNNFGLMWVGVEATTLLTAFLICIHASPGSLEAMWKYLLMCSVGVAVAFTGTLLVAASTASAGLEGIDVLQWSHLSAVATKLDPTLLKAAFIFLVIGYGTKAGLAPMHNWLPDAHSQAPAPVSAIFSGFMLNAALYCIMRCVPLVDAATGDPTWARGSLVVFGLISILVAAVFVIAQRDLKRLLAYSSVEHLGVITLGFGIGGLGSVAALFHMFNHSIGKAISFFCAGSIGQAAGSHDIRKMSRLFQLSPVWGGGLMVGLLILIGTAPFSIFLSEFLILKAAVDKGSFWIAGLFLLGLGIVFIGVLRLMITMVWDPAEVSLKPVKGKVLQGALIFIPLAGLLVLGLWIPHQFMTALTRAAQLLGGGM